MFPHVEPRLKPVGDTFPGLGCRDQHQPSVQFERTVLHARQPGSAGSTRHHGGWCKPRCSWGTAFIGFPPRASHAGQRRIHAFHLRNGTVNHSSAVGGALVCSTEDARGEIGQEDHIGYSGSWASCARLRSRGSTCDTVIAHAAGAGGGLRGTGVACSQAHQVSHEPVDARFVPFCLRPPEKQIYSRTCERSLRRRTSKATALTLN